MFLNKSTPDQHDTLLNVDAKIRDNLINFTTNFEIFNSLSIKLQASALVQLTESTNQLTRRAAVKFVRNTFFSKTKRSIVVYKLLPDYCI